MYPVILKPEAKVDLENACDWYEAQREGLSVEFLSELHDKLRLLSRAPKMYQRIFKDLRLTILNRFPYVVVYRFDEDQVTIIGVCHTSRHQRVWKSRV